MGRKTNESKLKQISDAIERGIDSGIDEIGYQLEMAYGNAIDRFYGHYPNPKFYNRTYSLYAGSDSWENPLKNKKKKGNGRYYIGINVGANFISENIGGNPYKSSIEYVFGRSYEHGIHGMTPEESTRRGLGWHKLPMSPSPKYWMEKNYKNIANKKYLDGLFYTKISEELAKIK